MKHARDDYNSRIQDTEGKIPEDEPVFLIRGQDMAGPGAVRAWAELNEALGGDADLTTSAYAQAERMAHWMPRKIADLPKETS